MTRMTTTIKVHNDTKLELNKFREHVNESYNDVIHKLIYIAKNVKEDPELSDEVIKAIEEARARIKAGHYYTEEEVKKHLGLK